MPLSFSSYPLWLNILIYTIAAGLIWVAGIRLERYTNIISGRTSMGSAFAGMLLLAAPTSLSEIVTTVTAVALLNNPTLAVHNLLGGVALQVAILVAADEFKKEQGALTYFSPSFVLLVEGVGIVILLQVVIAGVTAKGIPFLGSVSVWPVLVFLTYLGIMYLTHHFEGHPRWSPVDDGGNRKPSPEDREDSESPKEEVPMSRLWVMFAGVSLIVMIAGWGAALSADALAEQTGLGSAFMGATFLALATALPELSTAITATRDDQYSMAISNVFGGCAFNVALLFIAELLYYQDTIIKHADRSVLFISSIAAIMICIYLWGLMDRDDRSVFGIGWDSAASLLVYIGAVIVLYVMG